MILILCAFGAEFGPIRARLHDVRPLRIEALRGCEGQLGDKPITLLSTGIGVRNARTNSSRAIDLLRDIELIVITGVAGALVENLPVGRVVLGEKLMMCGAGSFAPERTVDVPRDRFRIFGDALHSAGIGYAAGPMMTSRHAIMRAADKRLAHASSGAITIDMESAAIAFATEDRGLPFICMRAILDSVNEDLAGANFADEDGNIRAMAAAKALLTNPAAIAGITRLVRNLRAATRSMAGALEAVMRRI